MSLDPQPITYQQLEPGRLRSLWNRFVQLPWWGKGAVVLVVAAIAAGIVWFVRAQLAPSAALTLQPAQSSTVVGQTLPVQIKLNTGGANVGTVRVIINYDTTKLSITPQQISVNGENAPEPYPADAFPIVAEKTVSGGQVLITAARPGGVNNTNVLFATLTFTATAAGTNVAITIDPASEVLTFSDDPQDVLATRTGGTYTITARQGQQSLTCSQLGGFVCDPSLPAPQTQICPNSNTIPASDVVAPQVCCAQACVGPDQPYVADISDQVSGTQATIAWTTKQGVAGTLINGGTCTVRFGTSSGNLTSSAGGTTSSVGSYQAVLTSLNDQTRYYYKIQCTTPSAFESVERSFFVGAASATLTLSGVAATKIRSTEAEIVWTTNLDADSHVMWDVQSIVTRGTCLLTEPRNCFNYSQEVLTATLRPDHRVVVTGLAPNTKYYYRVSSKTDPPGEQLKYSLEQSFTTTSGVLEPDANVVLKVQGNRLCSEWLSCRTGAQFVNDVNETEEMCFDVGLCRKLNKDGTCADPVARPDAPTDYELTYGNPAQSSVDLLRQRSGFFKPTFKWVEDTPLTPSPLGIEGTVYGWQHIGDMTQIGEKISVPNGNFEVSDFGTYPWIRLNESTTSIELATDARGGNDDNQVLQIVGRFLSAGNNGVYVPLGNGMAPKQEYIVAFDYFAELRKATNPNGPEELIVELQHGLDRAVSSGEFHIDLVDIGANTNKFGHWERGLAQFRAADNIPTDQGWLAIEIAGMRPNEEYVLKLDNVRIEPVLQLRPDSLVEKDCRLYANSTAIECEYIDEGTGRNVQGWKGFCLEPDPKNAQNCLVWWPVDVVKGESAMFSRDKIAGYSGQFPLYYCLESHGNMSRNPSLPLGGYQLATTYNIGPLTPLMESSGCKSLNEIANSKPYTFAVCRRSNGIHEWEAKRTGFVLGGGAQIIAAPEAELYEYDIERVYVRSIYNFGNSYPDHVLTRQKFESRAVEEAAGVQYRYERTVRPDGLIVWAARVVGETKEKNYMEIELRFNAQGKFFGYWVSTQDRTGGDTEGASYRVDFYLNEACRFVAGAVSPFGEQKAWTGRFASKTWASEDNNIIGYPYNFDGVTLLDGRPASPFGAMVPPPGLPEDWSVVVGAEPPDKLNFPQAPHQARAGGPYSVPSTQTGDYVCTEGKVGEPCSAATAQGQSRECEVTQVGASCDNFKCVNSTPVSNITPDANNCWDFQGAGIFDNRTQGINATCGGGFCSDFCDENNPDRAVFCDRVGTGTQVTRPTEFSIALTAPEDALECVECRDVNDCIGPAGNIPGTCSRIPDADKRNSIGNAYCIAGSADQLGKLCESSADCGFSISGARGKCVGVNLTSGQKGNLGGGVKEGVKRLQYLFAKSFGVWRLERDQLNDTYVYKKLENTASPGSQCQDYGLAPAGSAAGECSWDITGNPAFATPPRVTNLRLGSDQSIQDSDGNIIGFRVSASVPTKYANGFGSVVLLFNSSVDDNQLPLVRSTVDWGDGTVSSVSNLRVDDRNEVEKPHALVHTYLCVGQGAANYVGGSVDACVFTPRVQIEDNWGWCNGTVYACSNNTSVQCRTDAECGIGQCVPFTSADPLERYSGDGSRCTSYDEYAGEIHVACKGGSCANEPPIADAGPDQTVEDADNNGSQSVTLDGSASRDPDGQGTNPLTYRWTEGGALLGTTAVVTRLFTVGVHSVTLTVTDTRGLSASDSVTITVTQQVVNQRPTIQGFLALGSVNPVIFEAEVADPDNHYPLSVTLDFGDGTTPFIQTVTAPVPPLTTRCIDDTIDFGCIVTHAYTPRNTPYTAVLTVRDSGTPQATATAQRTVQVTFVAPPKILDFDVTPRSGALPLSVTFTADVIDTGSTFNNSSYPVEITIDFGDGTTPFQSSLPDKNTSILTTTHSYTTVGAYTATLTAQNRFGSSSQASAVITPGNAPPALPTNLFQSTGTEGQTTSDNTPRFIFTIADPDAGQKIGYEINIVRDVNFTQFQKVYTWTPVSTTNPNTVNFDIFAADALPNGSFWWRVRGVDEHSAQTGVYSDWVYFGNRSAVDFIVNAP